MTSFFRDESETVGFGTGRERTQQAVEQGGDGLCSPQRGEWGVRGANE